MTFSKYNKGDASILTAKVHKMRDLIRTGCIPERSIGFISSLCDYYDKHGLLSDRQRKYFDEYYDSGITAEKAEAASANSRIERLAPRIINPADTTQFLDHLQRAAETLKYVTVKFKTKLSPSGKLVISFTNTGTVYFHDGGSLQARERKTFATIGRDKKLVLMENQFPIELLAYINAIVADLPAEAAISGKEYAHCCFCGLELTNNVSLHHGYGPICASKFGLPWTGPRPAAAELLASLGDDSQVNSTEKGE